MRLIDADALIRKLKTYKKLFLDGWGGFDALPPKDKARVDELDNCIAQALNAPTIDPASLRPKGEWITMSYWKKRRGHHVQYVVKKCSLCNFRVKARWDNNFCPNCGADMRGE